MKNTTTKKIKFYSLLPILIMSALGASVIISIAFSLIADKQIKQTGIIPIILIFIVGAVLLKHVNKEIKREMQK